jgi:hypothetical protein
MQVIRLGIVFHPVSSISGSLTEYIAQWLIGFDRWGVRPVSWAIDAGGRRNGTQTNAEERRFIDQTTICCPGVTYALRPLNHNETPSSWRLRDTINRGLEGASLE